MDYFVLLVMFLSWSVFLYSLVSGIAALRRNPYHQQERNTPLVETFLADVLHNRPSEFSLKKRNSFRSVPLLHHADGVVTITLPTNEAEVWMTNVSEVVRMVLVKATGEDVSFYAYSRDNRDRNSAMYDGIFGDSGICSEIFGTDRSNSPRHVMYQFNGDTLKFSWRVVTAMRVRNASLNEVMHYILNQEGK